MDFKFQWDEDQSTDQKVCDDELDLVKNEFMSIHDANLEIIKHSKIDILTFENDIKLSIYNSKNLEDNLLKNETLISKCIFNTLNGHSDIEPGVYEGGFTIWDGSKNLIEYLIKEDIIFENKSVLELGCGYGLPGIYSILKNASNVCLQDFNIDVLKFCTIPNALLNLADKSCCGLSFVSGDWRGLTDCLEKDSFDIILTAETIYRESHYAMLVAVFKHALAPSGRVYLNTKSNYYGVGGNLNGFINYVRSEGTFAHDIIQTSALGAVRYVVVLKRL